MFRVVNFLVAVGFVIYALSILASASMGIMKTAFWGSETTLQDLLEQCGYESKKIKKIGAPSSGCIDFIREEIQTAHNRGVIGTVASGNKNYLLCLKELAELPDDELIRVVVDWALPLRDGSHVLPGDIFLGMGLVGHYRCTVRERKSG